MSDKAKKQASSIAFTISKYFNKVSTMKPSTALVTIVVIAGCILLLGGVVYDIVNTPYPAIYVQSKTGQGGKFYFLYPQLTEQFLFDTVVAGALYSIGFVGLLALYQSSKHAYNPRQAYMTMAIGAALILIAYLFIEYFIYAKVHGL